MMNMKKITALVLGLSLSSSLFAGCTQSQPATIDQAELERQIKAYLDENMEHYLNQYFFGGNAEAPAGSNPAQSTSSSLQTFQANTLDGSTFTQENIAGKDLTIIHFWALFCTPCIEEMPTLADFSKKLPDNVQLITVCLDGKSDIESAKAVLTQAGFEGITLLDGDGDFQTLCQEILYTPTTVFVDANGAVVAESIIGAPKNFAETYTSSINNALKSMGKAEIHLD